MNGYIKGEDCHTTWFKCTQCGEVLIFSILASAQAVRDELEAHRCPQTANKLAA